MVVVPREREIYCMIASGSGDIATYGSYPYEDNNNILKCSI
jgi:hypothetical protein